MGKNPFVIFNYFNGTRVDYLKRIDKYSSNEKIFTTIAAVFGQCVGKVAFNHIK